MVPAQWDLTNPSENNGGIWPMPISSFQHFCVKVDVELSADVNQSNNAAQTNFVDLTADCCRPFRFLVGNPFERDITARLVIDPLPKGYSVKLEGGGGEQGNPFVLRAREIRVATAQFVRPAGLRSGQDERCCGIDFDAGGQPDCRWLVGAIGQGEHQSVPPA